MAGGQSHTATPSSSKPSRQRRAPASETPPSQTSAQRPTPQPQSAEKLVACAQHNYNAHAPNRSKPEARLLFVPFVALCKNFLPLWVRIFLSPSFCLKSGSHFSVSTRFSLFLHLCPALSTLNSPTF